MALPTLAEVKTFLRVETSAEDSLIQDFMTQALARIEGWLRRPILSASAAFSGINPASYPVARSIRSGNGLASRYGGTSPAPALDSFADYSARIEPVLRGAMYDMVADKYHNRNPNRSSESSAGFSVSYNKSGIPMRVAEDLDAYRVR
jgi:hypothetical protein